MANFTIDEIDSVYVESNERFVVSLIVGYGATSPLVTRAEQAAAAALALTTDESRADTRWYVYDRATKEMTRFEQGDLEAVEFDEPSLE